MKTQCNKETIEFKRLGKRRVVADFGGGTLTSDAGALLLREADDALNLLPRVAECFTDHRDPDRIEHSVLDLVRQRVYGLSLGYEDLNDHDELSRDPSFAAVIGKVDPTGEARPRERDKGRPLAGKSTLNRLELSRPGSSKTHRYKRIELAGEEFERLLVDVFTESRDDTPDEIVLDFDATDDPLHGMQEGRFFQGYYKQYCYLPLYVFCGDDVLFARLRKSDIDGCAGTVDALEWIVPQIRASWPDVRIILRADSGFARDAIMTWCERNNVHFVIGLAKNSRLKERLADAQARAKDIHIETQEPARVFEDFSYSTLSSWTRERRVVGKAEHLSGGANPRYIVTSLPAGEWQAKELYEKLYCARGEMENRIKEQQMCLFADRTSAHEFDSNQQRLWMSTLGYVLVNAIRRIGLTGTSMARSRCDTIRLKLLKIGAAVTVSIRRVRIAMASCCPLQELFRLALKRLQAASRRKSLTPMRC